MLVQQRQKCAFTKWLSGYRNCCIIIWLAVQIQLQFGNPPKGIPKLLKCKEIFCYLFCQLVLFCYVLQLVLSKWVGVRISFRMLCFYTAIVHQIIWDHHLEDYQKFNINLLPSKNFTMFKGYIEGGSQLVKK